MLRLLTATPTSPYCALVGTQGWQLVWELQEREGGELWGFFTRRGESEQTLSIVQRLKLGARRKEALSSKALSFSDVDSSSLILDGDMYIIYSFKPQINCHLIPRHLPL